MFSMFNTIDRNDYKKSGIGGVDYVIDKYKDNFQLVKSYYNNKESSVKNNHMFVKFIKMLSSHSKDQITFYKTVRNNGMYISRLFEFTNSISIGTIHKNIMYENESNEVFINRDDSLSPFDLIDNWKDYEPIKLVESTNTDMMFQHPSKVTSNMFTLNVFSVDVVGMCLQYKEWCIERIKYGYDIDPATYVYQYLLTNLLKSSIDLNILNRYMALGTNSDTVVESVNTHPFYLPNYDDKLDKILTTVRKLNNKRKMYYGELLYNIPTVFNTSHTDTLFYPVGTILSQNEWSMFISRARWVLLLNRMNKKGKSLNTKQDKSVPVFMKRYKNEIKIDRYIKDIVFVIYHDTYVADINKIFGKR